MGTTVEDKSPSPRSDRQRKEETKQPYVLNLALKKENLQAISEYSHEDDGESAAGFTRGDEELDKE
jgi:hypothetical protein